MDEELEIDFDEAARMLGIALNKTEDVLADLASDMEWSQTPLSDALGRAVAALYDSTALLPEEQYSGN